MTTLKISRLTDLKQLVPVGTVTVQKNGDLFLDTKDELLRGLMTNLVVTASIEGGTVPTSDPNYALAVADSIGRASIWHYVASLE